MVTSDDAAASSDVTIDSPGLGWDVSQPSAATPQELPVFSGFPAKDRSHLTTGPVWVCYSTVDKVYQLGAMNKDVHHCGGTEAEAGWLRNTLLFRQWESMKQEILLHKWYESEKAGHDIGWERASVDWMIRYGPAAAKERSCR
jgi:hypothetical protein